jgi:hypothetical protein
MRKNINKKPFDEATNKKLEIFGECFREWLPIDGFKQTLSELCRIPKKRKAISIVLIFIATKVEIIAVHFWIK